MSEEIFRASVADIRLRFFRDPWHVFPELELSDLLDRELVRRLSGASVPAANGCSVLAAGGYGRRTLHPGSDLDLLFLFRGPPESRTVSAVVAAIGDSGFEVGNQVRSFTDFSVFDPSDIDSLTAFLETRHLWGDSECSAEWANGILPVLVRTYRLELLSAIAADRERRHAASGETDRREPDLKRGPGGLRDYHAVRWAARVAGIERPAAADEAAVALRRIRNALHYLADSGDDVLRRPYQARIASLLGFGEGRSDRLMAVCRDCAATLTRCWSELETAVWPPSGG